MATRAANMAPERRATRVRRRCAAPQPLSSLPTPLPGGTGSAGDSFRDMWLDSPPTQYPGLAIGHHHEHLRPAVGQLLWDLTDDLLSPFTSCDSRAHPEHTAFWAERDRRATPPRAGEASLAALAMPPRVAAGDALPVAGAAAPPASSQLKATARSGVVRRSPRPPGLQPLEGSAYFAPADNGRTGANSCRVPFPEDVPLPSSFYKVNGITRCAGRCPRRAVSPVIDQSPCFKIPAAAWKADTRSNRRKSQTTPALDA
jgi:hypothetical protein